MKKEELKDFQKRKDKEKVHIPKDLQKPKIKILLEGFSLVPILTLISQLKGEAIKKGYRVKGPVSMPLKKHEIAVRKAPGSFGSETYRKYHLKKYKKIIYFYNSELESALMDLCNSPRFDEVDKRIELN